jgi:hypothetical protein
VEMVEQTRNREVISYFLRGNCFYAELLVFHGGVAPNVTMAAVISIVRTRIQRQVLLNPVRHLRHGMTG